MRRPGWTKYIREFRPRLAVEPDDGTLFVLNAGEAFHLDHLRDAVRGHVDAALSRDGKPGKRGACHLFRHTTATLMLEHARLDTTQIYTQGVNPAAKTNPFGGSSRPLPEAAKRSLGQATTLRPNGSPL